MRRSDGTPQGMPRPARGAALRRLASALAKGRAWRIPAMRILRRLKSWWAASHGRLTPRRCAHSRRSCCPLGGPHQRPAHLAAAAARAMEAAWTLPACPLRQRRQGSGRAAPRSLPPPPQRASVGVFHAFPFHGTPHRSLLRDPHPGAPHLSRSPWASAKQLASRPMAMSASPTRSVAAASRSRSSA